jgi:hypothetical protein
MNNSYYRAAIAVFGRAGLPAIASRSGEAGVVARPKCLRRLRMSAVN